MLHSADRSTATESEHRPGITPIFAPSLGHSAETHWRGFQPSLPSSASLASWVACCAGSPRRRAHAALICMLLAMPLILKERRKAVRVRSHTVVVGFVSKYDMPLNVKSNDCRHNCVSRVASQPGWRATNIFD